MVRPSAFPETVTPAIFSPDSDLTVPASRTPFETAETALGLNAANDNPTAKVARILANIGRFFFMAFPLCLIYWFLLPACGGVVFLRFRHGVQIFNDRVDLSGF